MGWYGSAYLLTSAALQPLTGKLYVNFETKWTFMTFLAILEVGSLLCGVAVSSKMLIIGRAVAGIGVSGILNGAFTIIAGCVPMPKRPMLIGIVQGCSQLGLVCGPLIGGTLTQYATWRWCFYINLPCGAVVAAVLYFVHIPAQMVKPKAVEVVKELHEKLDLIGFVLFAPAAVMLLLALQYGGNQYAWNSSVVIGLFCGATAIFLVFCAWDIHKKDDAMIPVSMIRKRIVWSSCIVYGFFLSQLYTGTYYLPIYFQAVKGVSPTLSGVYMLPSILSQLVIVIGVGRLIGKIGYYLPFSIFSAILIAISNGLISTFTANTDAGRWVGYQILLGVGRGFGLQVPIVAVQNNLHPKQIPVAMALLMFSQALGGAMFLSFSSTIFTNSLRNLIPQYAPGVDPQAIVDAGAIGFRNLVKGDDLNNVLVAYALSVDRVFYLVSAAAICCFIFGWGMGWKDIRKKAPPETKA